MRRRHAAAVAGVLAVLAAGTYAAANRQTPTPKTVWSIAPGALAQPQPTVAQLCTPGYTATVRPPASFTTTLKIRQMKTYRLPGSAKDYEADHKIPLELGGAPRDERNIWPEPWAEAHLKDKAENAWHASVCAGRASLAQAQAVFLMDRWATVSAP